jgi:hypothetical protein
MRTRMLVPLLVLSAASTARAQVTVIDPGNLIQTVLIAQRAQRHYETLVAQFRTVRQMAQGIALAPAYRIPVISPAGHDLTRWTYARPWLQGLNSGDAAGQAYLATAVVLERPGAWPAWLSAQARRGFERQYATAEIADSVAMMGGHQIGLMRGYQGQLQRAIQFLEGDIFSGADGAQDMTAVLDKIAAGELLGRRQDMATNQLMSHALEQLLARGKRLRDTEVVMVNMQLRTWREAPAANDAMVRGAGDAIRTWRQP